MNVENAKQTRKAAKRFTASNSRKQKNHDRAVYKYGERVIFEADAELRSRKSFWRRHPDSNRGITVLQTAALPLGYAAPKAEN